MHFNTTVHNFTHEAENTLDGECVYTMMLAASGCLFLAWVLLFCNKLRHMSRQLRSGWIQDPQRQWFDMANVYSHKLSMEKVILLFLISALVLYIVDHVLQHGRCFVHRWLLVIYVSCVTSVCGYEFFEKTQENNMRYYQNSDDNLFEEYPHENADPRPV